MAITKGGLNWKGLAIRVKGLSVWQQGADTTRYPHPSCGESAHVVLALVSGRLSISQSEREKK